MSQDEPLTTAAPPPAATTSPWEPLKGATFRYLWLATLVSNIGSWMHEVGAGWLMTTLTSSPVMIALVQTATSLPAVFVLLPSGALSDIIDRRLYLLGSNIIMGITALMLGIMVVTGVINEWSLLGLTFMLGIGLAMNMPAWQAIVPEIVPKSSLRGAIVLNTMGQNISRALGALIAGAIIAYVGNGAVFLCNAATFIFIIWVLARWKRTPLPTKLPPEGFLSAVATGLRYTRHSPALQATLIRGVSFFFFASVMWALLPLIATDLLQGNEHTFSYLYAAISTGAISCAFVMPRLRSRFSNDQLINFATIAFTIGMVLTATVHHLILTLLSLALCGSSWITVMTCSQIAAQAALPSWIKSRGLSVFLTFFMGAMAIGPYIWGNIAAVSSLSTAILIAATGAMLACLFSSRWSTSDNLNLDHSPSGHWQQPQPSTPIDPQQGPIIITVRYQVEDGKVPAFLALMDVLAKSRRRDGASQWNIMQDTNNLDAFTEFYMVNTWLDHLRQHERISKEDASTQQQIRELLRKDSLPLVTHFVKPKEQ